MKNFICKLPRVLFALLSPLLFFAAITTLFCPTITFAQVTKQKNVNELEQDLNKINQSIDTTREKMKTVKDARFLPDLYFMLAEFYSDKSRYMYQIKRLKNKGAPDAELDFTAESRPKQQAIEIYQNILDKFPTLPELDRAYFFMAHEYRELGKLDEMIKIYQKITKQFPDSQYWSESQLIIGNYFFEQKKDVEFALEIYQQILKKPPGPFTPLARYKIGWCYINQGKFKEALLSFEDVLTQDKNVDLSTLPEIYKLTDIRRDALLALVWPYSEIPPSSLKKMGEWRLDPVKYVHQLSNNKVSYQKVLFKLGQRLALKFRHIASTRAYYEYLTITEDLESKMDAIDRIYESMRATGKAWPIYGYVQEIAQTIQRVRQSPDLKEKERLKAYKNYEIYARDVATHSHERAKQTKNPIDYKLALRDYETYLWAFPETKFELVIKLNMAESYFNIKNYVEAGKFYEELANRIKTSGKRKSYLDSAVQSYTEALKDLPSLNRTELVQARNGMRAIAKQFVAGFPSDPATPMVRYNAARTLYDERDFDLAVVSFKDFLKFHPTHKNAELAANLILDCFNQKEDYDGLIKEGTAITKNNAISSTIRSGIAEIVKQAQYKKIQAKAGDFSSPEYGKKLLQYADQYKGTEVGDKALYEAFTAFKSKKDPQAYSVGETLLARHANSQYAKSVASEMGKMALLTADFSRASKYFESYATKYPNDPESKQMLKSAGQMREFMADFEDASKDYKLSGQSELSAKMDAKGARWTALQSSSSQAGGMKSQYYRGLAEYRLGNYEVAKGYLKSASQGGSSPEEKTMAAHALYLLTSDAVKAYKSVQLVAGKEAQIVPQKAKMLENLTSQLNRVIAFGNGKWTIASLYSLGLTNLEFASFLNNAPMPAGLNGDQQKQYQQAISAQAQKYTKSAENYFNQCISSAEKFEVFTNFSKGCLSKGTQVVSEENESKNFVRSSGANPPDAATIRKKLYDDSRNTKLLQDLATSHIKAGDYAMGALILNRALELKPNDPKIQAEQGQAYLFMSDYEAASELFRKSLTSGKKDPLASWGIAALYKEFQFAKKFKSALLQAKSQGKPQNAFHPWINALN